MTVGTSALVVGASRGLGLALVREMTARGASVIATIRGPASTDLSDLAARSEGRLVIEPLEMTDPDSLAALNRRLGERTLDVLFVNAGIANGPHERVDQASEEAFVRVMVTNAYAPLQVVERLGDRVAADGTIGVMSSSIGSVSLNQTGGWEVYRASKAALNMLMRSYAARHRGDRRSLVLMDPGWVRTDMGGSGASLGIEESIPGVVDALESRRGKPGLVFLNYKGETVPW